MKKTIAFSIAILMIFSIFVVFLGYAPHDTQSGYASMPMVASSYHGNITIEPNGNIVASSPGAPISHTSGSNVYTFTGNINGTLNVERSSAQIEGAGYSLYNSTSSSLFVLNISNVNSVTINDLSVNASGTLPSSFGVFLYNTTGDNLENMSISATITGIFVSNMTSYVNITGSMVSGISNNGFLFAGIALGAYLPGAFGYPQMTNSTSHISLISDTLVARNTGPALLEVSNNTILKSTVIDASNFTYSESAVMMGGSNLVVADNTFNLYNASAINITGPYNRHLSGLDITGNTILDTLGSDVTTPIVYANGISTISKNSMQINAAGIKTVVGILTNGRMANVSNNYINITNGSNSYGDQYNFISLNSTSIHVVNNVVLGDSDSYFIGISTITHLPLFYLNNSVISNNTISLNTQVGGIGIDLNAVYTPNNLIIADNTIHIYNLLWTGSDAGSGNSFGIESSGSNQTLTGNKITLSGGAANFGIYFSIGGYPTGHGSNITESHNQISISDKQYATGLILNNAFGNTYSRDIQVQYNSIELFTPNSYTGISITNLNYTSVIDNMINSPNVTSSSSNLVFAQDSNNITIVSNTLFGPSSGKGTITAISMTHVSYSLIGNNTVYNTTYGTSLSASDNFTIYGNYFTNTSQDALGFNTVENATIYHNDFLNYTGISMTGIKNIRFNLSYPIGGNYWSNLSGHSVDQKSGSGQNIAGSDGINDTPFSPSKGVTDYYPLVSKWVRPQAVFHAPDGINGTTWKVTFNGVTKTTTGNTISFNITNGAYEKYSYTYYNSTLYYTNSSNGTFSYAGNSSTINVPYLHYSYIIGHLNLTNFTVQVNGKLLTVSNGSFNLTVTAGSYDVVISSTGYATFNNTYNVTPGEVLNVSPVLGINHPRPPLLPGWAYIAGIVAVIAVAGGIAVYIIVRRRK